MKKTIFWADQDTAKTLETSLCSDNVSITSTDTILGFLAPLTESGVKKLHAIKGSRAEKTYILLVASPAKISKFVDMSTIDDRVQKIMDSFWPGPLTIVFKANQDAPSHLVAGDQTIALRCPQHEALRKFLASFDGLLSTSVNHSGQPAALTVDQIPEDILSAVDCVVIDDLEKPKAAKPSTIIDVSQPGQIKVLREGALPVERLALFF